MELGFLNVGLKFNLRSNKNPIDEIDPMLPRIYILPNIHKSIRPIISGIRFPTYKKIIGW